MLKLRCITLITGPICSGKTQLALGLDMSDSFTTRVVDLWETDYPISEQEKAIAKRFLKGHLERLTRDRKTVEHLILTANADFPGLIPEEFEPITRRISITCPANLVETAFLDPVISE
jgi:hypothetical protein